MKPLVSIFLLLLLTLIYKPLFAQEIKWQQQQSPTTASLRSLHIIDDQIIWISGSNGAILRTLNGGIRWQQILSPDSLDFRSLWAFDSTQVMVASAGQPARVYYTANAGQQWELVYEDSTGLAFFDALQFWDDQRGWLLSDPLKGDILLLETHDRGKSWVQKKVPAPLEGEAFFAASNGSLALASKQHAWIGTGGAAIRVLATTNAGESWSVQKTPLLRLSPASGIYAMVFANTRRGVAIGGAYDRPADANFTACYTTNGGKRWKLPLVSPRGYRSGIAHMPPKRTFVAVGSSGSDISTDGGKTWRGLNDENLNSIRFSPSGKKGWAVGAGGKIFILNVN